MRKIHAFIWWGIVSVLIVPILAAEDSTVNLTNYVSLLGNDTNTGAFEAPWRSIQKACDSAEPGSLILVQPGVYNEKIIVHTSGTARDGYITLQANGPVTVTGTNIAGNNIFYLEEINYFKIIGFDIRDNWGVESGAGIWIEGGADHIELRNNQIHEIRGRHAMGITVYGSSSLRPATELVIDHNEIFDCEPADSEALTLNGNVTSFQVSNNLIRDVNNIGIDFIGGEGMCPDPNLDAARNGVCRGNTVQRARSIYGFAAGIYVDGGRDIVLEGNRVTACDVGFSIGAENRGATTTNIIVRNNLAYANDKNGLVLGAFSFDIGQVKYCQILNNTFYQNDVLSDQSNGELWIQRAENSVVRNNIFVAGSQNLILAGETGSRPNYLDYNLWWGSVPADLIFRWDDTNYDGFIEYQTLLTQELHSILADPEFINPATGDFRLRQSSPAKDSGDPVYLLFAANLGTKDFVGQPRVIGLSEDLGAFELQWGYPKQTVWLPPVKPNGIVQLRLLVEPGRTYVIEASTNMLEWTPIQTNSTLNNILDTFDPAPAAKFRFYRAKTSFERGW